MLPLELRATMFEQATQRKLGNHMFEKMYLLVVWRRVKQKRLATVGQLNFLLQVQNPLITQKVLLVQDFVQNLAARLQELLIAKI